MKFYKNNGSRLSGSVPILISILVLGILGQNVIFCSTGKNLPDVLVDPRVELLSLIFRLAGNPEYNRCGIPSYNEDIERYFAKYKEHSVIKMVQQLRRTRGVSFDAVMSLAIHITGPDALQERIPFEPHPKFLDKRWPPKKTSEFLNAARDFAKKTKFNTFFAEHQELYKTTTARMKKVLQDRGHFDWFDTFFGRRPGARFTVIPGLLNGGSCYGVRINPTASSEEMYSIIGVWKVDNEGIPLFNLSMSGFNIMPTIVHEFCHSYVNPLVDKHEKLLEKAGKTIFSYVVEDMKRQAYGSWKTVIYESLVRACVVRYILTHNGPTAAQKRILKDKQNKFIWIGELADLLGEYAAKRKKYPDLDAFFPRIVTFFNDYSAQNKGKLAAILKEKKKSLEIMKENAPKIISINPANGASDVDPNLQAITITFDRPMRDRSWSIMRVSQNFPELRGSPSYDKERKVLTVPVKLQPGRLYEFGLNAENYLGFRSEQGVPLIPVRVQFKTR